MSKEPCDQGCAVTRIVASGPDVSLSLCIVCHKLTPVCPSCGSRMHYMAPAWMEMHCVSCTHETNFAQKPDAGQLALGL